MNVMLRLRLDGDSFEGSFEVFPEEFEQGSTDQFEGKYNFEHLLVTREVLATLPTVLSELSTLETTNYRAPRRHAALGCGVQVHGRAVVDGVA